MKMFSKAMMGAVLVFLTWDYPVLAEDSQPAAFKIGNVEFLADEPSYLDFGAGAFDIVHSEISAAGYIEYRYGKKLSFIGPVMGIMANTDGGVFGYGGIYTNIKYRRLVATPFFTVGGYHQGGSKDLGGTFQFRSGITFAYQFDKGSRLGVRFAHISNASIHDNNPGENELLLTYSLPLAF
ncbi:acyloxyacyl hydrolase [Nitrosococcus watsonii]|uniref:Lipid A 3-O-deacylase-related protein n=1 Tax=Nitrosococcus watsoni (strain C-113) TaxID=105559 RepID=D8K7J2_NITWC|nr:acyloxyacyl hydrolase [Nitrosococcus watsonii]ADJ28869.1 Lipid A 3-O-deacylase-related protein [Nitrosococcus watsonii C-113]